MPKNLSMKKMELVVSDYRRTVYVDNLLFKKYDMAGMEVNEIVSVSLYIDEPEKIKKDSSELRLESDGISFFIKDLEEYEMSTLSKKLTSRVTFKRRFSEFIMMDETKEEKNGAQEKVAEKKKISKLSKAYPVVFIDVEEPFEQKEWVYHMVRNGITTPMVPNMLQHLILAGQMFIDKDEAKILLEHVLGIKKAPKLSRSLVSRAKYLVKTYQNWVDTIFAEMKEQSFLKPIHVFVSTQSKQPYEVIVEEKHIEPLISELVSTSRLTFTEAKKVDEVEGFDNYMTQHATMMTKRIEATAKPVHRWGELRQKTMNLIPRLERKPFEAQLNAIEASLKALELRGKVNMIAEMGTGKTFMTTATQYIHAVQMDIALKLLILCPDHLVDTVWEEEINKTVKEIVVHKIESVSDLMRFEQEGLLDDGVHRAFILAQKYSKDTIDVKPAVIWNKIRQSFSCPCCGEVVTRRAKETNPDTKEVTYYNVPVAFTHFNTLRYNNYKCKKCKEVLWEPINPNASSFADFVKGSFLKNPGIHKKYVYSGDLKGFYPNDAKPVRAMIAKLVYDLGKADGKVKANINQQIEHYRNLELIIAGKKKEGIKRSVAKASVSDYIFKKMKYKFNHLIVDELHEYQNESKRADACARLIHSVKYVQAGTGTGMNGYAASRFRTDYMMAPEKMKKAGFGIDDADRYQATFGVVERKYRYVEKNGKRKREALSPRRRPGISPVIFPLFMQDTTVFVSMDDFENEMPPIEYLQVPVEMDAALLEAHKTLKLSIKSATQYDKKMFRSTVAMNYSYLDTPTVKKELKNKLTGETVVETPVIEDYQNNKLVKLLEIAKNEVMVEGRRMIIYTNFSGDNINEYLHQHLVNAGYKVCVLNPVDELSVSCDGTKQKVDKPNREKYIREDVANGAEILIVNPELIKTGYNLIDFHTVLYFQMGYQVYTNRQADRRPYRLGQTKNVRIIYLFYKDTIQEQIASLMATKIIASRSIEGNMDEDGLQSLCMSRTAEEELSQQFYNGIKGKVELRSYTSAPSSAA